ncbi:Gfo/Idh/MocA family oxidoreductase [Azotosporobacter soli]|uniref:Gfo/Idh/MocA family protein n=1 Tax=Azotosporobacter soli TaxID=3055040 RepID=UPI0031FEFFCE
MIKALVVGYGSIGSRHAKVLRELGCDVTVVSERVVDFPQTSSSLAEAFSRSFFDYVVIANRTGDHYRTVCELIRHNYEGVVLIEKPIFEKTYELPKHNFKHCYVAYNLRFHPLMQKLKAAIETEKVISVQVYVGQYLPNWRPESDYRVSYSASKSKGGGVLRDLSHELDYLLWLFGDWNNVVAIGGKYSQLDIESEDVFAILAETKRCPIINIQMNYLDRNSKREIIVNTEKHSIKLDFVKGSFELDGDRVEISVERDFTYGTQHKAVLSGETGSLCTLEQGYKVMRFLESIEKSAMLKRWISNEKDLYDLC